MKVTRKTVGITLAAVGVIGLICFWGLGGKERLQIPVEEPEGTESPLPREQEDAALRRVKQEGKMVAAEEEPPCIVVDPGHGGFDPGKVGVGDVREKDINLQIAMRVEEYLTAAGVRVVMTRQEDLALCDESGENKKVQDLKNRIAVMEQEAPRAVLSIHQNSYPEENVKGAQVFYYKTSVEGKKLAEKVQSRLVNDVDPDNHRQVKANDSYFLLKKTAVPLVIAECGFLSNPEEAKKLCTEEYQDTVAWALYLGIMDYLEEKQ